jgi:hypothetical protein
VDRPPGRLACDLLGGGAGLELLIGYTRLGNLLALLDREVVPEAQKHLVWSAEVLLRQATWYALFERLVVNSVQTKLVSGRKNNSPYRDH